ncbi:hypothetical protein G2W53_039995 [Senna tora]|uniref:Uncharacterized protein n=1 Tax=Senna tora TaxID=362788 RepID=A0A834SPP3_9FABA|nr:hypothetical protein G2W53_039995 [Senna tora]
MHVVDRQGVPVCPLRCARFASAREKTCTSDRFDAWDLDKGEGRIEATRAESQWIVAARPLCHLQYPVAYLSRLQRILPATQWEFVQGVPCGSSAARGARIASSADSDLEAFSHNPTHATTAPSDTSGPGTCPDGPRAVRHRNPASRSSRIASSAYQKWPTWRSRFRGAAQQSSRASYLFKLLGRINQVAILFRHVAPPTTLPGIMPGRSLHDEGNRLSRILSYIKGTCKGSNQPSAFTACTASETIEGPLGPPSLMTIAWDGTRGLLNSPP